MDLSPMISLDKFIIPSERSPIQQTKRGELGKKSVFIISCDKSLAQAPAAYKTSVVNFLLVVVEMC